MLSGEEIRTIEKQHLERAKSRKPHHYGLVNGVHVFHATVPEHDSLYGVHLHDADDSAFAQAISTSRNEGTPIILHGEPPPSLGQDGTMSQDRLKKAFTQADGETMTDPREHQPQSVDQSLMAWGAQKLSPLKIDDLAQFAINQRIVKIRKVLDDLYSGWVEYQGKQIHHFEKLTLPALLTQLQSKLELYGKEKELMADQEKKIEMPAKDLIEEHKKLISVLESPSHKDDLEEAKEQRKELAGYEAEAKKPEVSIAKKIKKLRQKLDETKETIATKDLISGIEDPAKECPACERGVDSCICYMNLPAPRVEFDGKKLTIFFKGEWNEEDRLNFMSDIKSRAGRILLEQRKEMAKSALAEIRKKLK